MDAAVEVNSVDENETKALPSMPILLSAQSLPGSPKNEGDELSDENLVVNFDDDTKPKFETLNVEDDGGIDSIPAEGCEELVLQTGNSPTSEKRKSAHCHQHHLPKKKKKLDTFDGVDGAEEEPGNHYADAYFSKVKSTLDETKFQQFVALLSETADEPGSIVPLYRKLQELLADYPELIEDFVGTLKPHQALEIGKLLELKFISRSLAFFRKLEGNHLTRVIHVLEQLSSNNNITHEAVKASILPLLKGHGPLAETFLHLLPSEKPPLPCSTDDYEDITESMFEEGDDGGWENVRIPEHPERSCLVDCSCRCHTIPSQPFCLACNIRFIKGQVYVQYGKIIRYCKVHFGDMSHDEVLQRFNPSLYSKRRRKRKSINKPPPTLDLAPEILFQDENAVISKEDVQLSFSPTKLEEKLDDDDDYYEEDDVSSGDKSSAGDVFEDMDRHSEDTEDRIIEQINNPLSPLGSTVEGVYAAKWSDDSFSDIEEVEKGVVIDVSDIHSGVNAQVIEFKTRAPVESSTTVTQSPDKVEAGVLDSKVLIQNVEMSSMQTSPPDEKQSPDVDPKDEPRDPKVIVTLQQNVPSTDKTSANPDTNDLNGSSSQVVASDRQDVPEASKEDTRPERERCLEDGKEWTRQEDKLILEAFQREVGTEETFAQIRSLMPTRSVDQIQGRFQVLMKLLEKVASGSRESNSS